VAALVAVLFATYELALLLAGSPAEESWACADPILRIVPRELTLAASLVTPVVAAVVWLRFYPIGRGELAAGAREAFGGALLALVAMACLRVAMGPTMPPFIPPEESACPGYLLGMAAGLDEEVVCRLVLMPLLYFSLRRRAGVALAGVTATIVTAAFFAAWHAAGESPFSATYCMTRFLVPGCAMSLVWLASPPAIVAAHATAHIAIPALFATPG